MTFDQICENGGIKRVFNRERISVWEYCLKFSVGATVSKSNQEKLYNAYLSRWDLDMFGKYVMYNDDWEYLTRVMGKIKMRYQK